MTSSSPSAADTTAPGPVVPARRAAGVLLIVLIGLCLVFVASYLQKLGEKAVVEAQIVVMQQQIEQAKVRTAILGKELAQVNDEAHIAAIARDSLNLVQEGDQLIAIVAASASAAPDAAAAANVRVPIDTSANWQRWLDLLFPN